MKYLALTLFLIIFVVSCTSTKEAIPDGFVRLAFDINEQGKAINIKVIESHPKDKYDESAIETLKSWQYDPKVVDGMVIVQKDLTVQLNFKEEK